GDGEQPAQHRQLHAGGHDGELAHLRRGARRRADALGADQPQVPVLILMKLRLLASVAATLLFATPATHAFTQRSLSTQRTISGLVLRALRAPRGYVRDGGGDQQQPSPKKPVFRGNTQIVSVDVIVRDGSGAVGKG